MTATPPRCWHRHRVASAISSCGAGVELASSTERQSFVCGVAHQRLSEAKHARMVLDQEVVELVQRRGVERWKVGCEELVELLEGDEPAEHRGAAQHVASVRRQPVDLRRNRRLDRIRKGIGVADRHERGQQLVHEQRVATRAFRQLPDVLREHRRVRGGERQGAGGVVDAQRQRVGANAHADREPR